MSINKMNQKISYDIPTNDLYTKSKYYTLRSIFQPANNNQCLLDRGLSDWETTYSTNQPLKLKFSSFDKFDLFTLIWVAQRGTDVFERYQALSQLQKRGWVYQEQFGWINAEQDQIIDNATWTIRKNK